MPDGHLKLRSDLIVHSETGDDQTFYTLKDPITGRFFRLRAPDYYLLTRADGETSPAEAARRTGERFGIRIPLEAAVAFFARMERLLFFEGPAIERYTATANIRQRSLWLIPLKAFDPDAVLERWIPRVRFLFRPLGVAAGLVLILAAGIVAVSQTSLWTGDVLALWKLTSIPLLLGAVLVIAWVHETGHALTLKHFGGAVHEMGFLLLYFQPCFYCNISDTYLLPNRRSRLLVGVAGLFFQGLVTALAILAWRVLEPGNLISDFLWVTAAVSLALFLFNFNPLIKLDGYYMLVDLLRIPNLRSKSFRYWRGVLAEWLFARAPEDRIQNPRLRRVYRWYGIAAAVYTGVFVGWMLYHLTLFLHKRWGIAGVGIIFGLIVALVMQSRNGGAKDESVGGAAEAAHASGPRGPNRWKKPLIIWGSLGLLLLLSAVIPLERRVGSSCTVAAGSRFAVTTPVGGTLETELLIGGKAEERRRATVQATTGEFSVVAYGIRVREGDSASIGDTLVVLSSNRYRAELLNREAERDRVTAERNLLLSGPKKDKIVQLRAELSEIEAQVANKRHERDRGQLLWDGQLISREEFDAKKTELEMAEAQREAKKSELAFLISEPKAEELAVKDAQIAGFNAEVEFLKTQIAASTILSPIDGIVIRVERAGSLVEVADFDPARLQLTVDEDDIADVADGAPVTLKVRPHPGVTFYGRVVHITADADTTGGRRHFGVITDIENSDLKLRPGMSGYAKIDCGRRSALFLAGRRLIQFVRVEFWSWW